MGKSWEVIFEEASRRRSHRAGTFEREVFTIAGRPLYQTIFRSQNTVPLSQPRSHGT